MIKLFEDYEENIEKNKKLFSYINTFYNELGYTNDNYYNNGKFESVFHDKNGKPSHVVVLEKFFIDTGSTIKFVYTYCKSNMFIVEYFKTIDGLKIIHQRQTLPLEYFLFKVTGDVDNIIKQITVDDYNFKKNTKKYNL